jgi:threonine dehydrogenase-like Zn-dependent dehydrogenase
MKADAVFLTGPGKTEIRSWDVPDPSHDEVQVKCVANGICMGDVALFAGIEPSHYPRPIGHEGLGVVIKAPSSVGFLREGDYVDCYGWSTIQNVNAYRVSRFKAPPTDPGACLVEPVACVVTALYSYDICPGDRVLLVGAGFMGLLNVQALAGYPLADLVVADVKPRNLDLARQFGATELIDAASPQGQQRLSELKAQPFDLVIESAGTAATIQSAGEYCRHGGRLAIFAWHHDPRALDLGLWHMRGLKVLNCAPGIGTDHNISSFQRAATLLELGRFDLGKLVTHRHPMLNAQQALELSVSRPPEYIKGVLTTN